MEEVRNTMTEDSANLNLTPEQIAELDERLDALEATSEAGTPRNVVRNRIQHAISLGKLGSDF